MDWLNKYLTKDEQDAFLHHIRYIATANNRNSKVNLGKVLEPWYEAKKGYLLNLFGDKLILEFDLLPDTPDFGKGQFEQDLYSMIIYSPFLSRVNAALHDGFISSATVKNQGQLSSRFLYYLLSDRPAWQKNKCGECQSYAVSDTVVTFSNGKILKFNRETKMTTVAAAIAEAFDLKEEYEKFRLEHSMIVQEYKTPAKVCFSIHPLDYLTISDNNSNWSSCLSITNEGSYRGGVSELLSSECAVVCYIKSSSKKVLMQGDFKWNSKFWRQILVLDPNFIGSLIAYPNECVPLTKQILKIAKDLWAPDFPDHLYNRKSDDEDFYSSVPGDTTIPDRLPSYVSMYTNLLYNDFHRSTSYQSFYCYASSQMFKENCSLDIELSGVTSCLICGRVGDEDQFPHEDCLVCRTCIEGPLNQECLICGKEMRTTNTFFDEGGDSYCESCYLNNYARCWSCGCEIPLNRGNSHDINYMYGSTCSSYFIERNLCQHCLDNRYDLIDYLDLREIFISAEESLSRAEKLKLIELPVTFADNNKAYITAYYFRALLIRHCANIGKRDRLSKGELSQFEVKEAWSDIISTLPLDFLEKIDEIK